MRHLYASTSCPLPPHCSLRKPLHSPEAQLGILQAFKPAGKPLCAAAIYLGDRPRRPRRIIDKTDMGEI